MLSPSLRRGVHAALALAAVAGATIPAITRAAPAPAADAASGIEEVIVTAQRREQSAQDVGVALTVLSGDDLTARGIGNVNALQYAAPSLEIVPAFGGGQPQFRLRGVGFDDYASNNTSTVGVYVNEVAYTLPIQTQGLLFDIDRVEVLRGPQGTLYGRNTTGGAINFITRRPTEALSAGVSAEFGRWNALQVEGFVSGPVSDTLRFRLAGITQQGGDWQENRVTGESTGEADKVAVRGQLLWAPHDGLEALLDLHYSKDQSDGAGLYLFRDLSGSFGSTNFTLPGSVLADQDRSQTGWGGSSIFTSFTGIATDQKPFRDNETHGVDLNIKADVGLGQLTSITAWETLDRKEYNDWDASPNAFAGTYFGSDARVLSQEVRLASTGEGATQWVAGAYYLNERLREQFASDFIQSLGFDTDTTYEQKVQSWSLFGQVDHKLTDRWTLVAGLRQEHEKRSLGNFLTAGVFAPGVTGNFIPPSDVSATTDETSGKLGLEFRPSEQLLVYGSLSRGIKSGGFTAYNTPDVALLHPIKPEKLHALEVGFKYTTETLALNGAVYYYDYQDQQVQSAIYTAFGPIGNIVNADSTIYGAELELDWRPAPGWRIAQAIGWKQGEFDKFDDLDIAASVEAGEAVLVSRAGQDQGLAPVSYTATVGYNREVSGWRVETDLSASFRDEYKPVLLGPTYNIDSYWLVGANIALSPVGGRWQVALYGRNLFNEEYDLTRNFFLPPVSIAAPGQPRSYGLRVSYAF